jgi:hypothetical protein
MRTRVSDGWHLADAAREVRSALIAWPLAAMLLGFAAPAPAEVPAVGTEVQGSLDLAGKQVVLPEGDWVIAGHGFDQVADLEDVPYGAIENVVLFKLAGGSVAAFVLAQHNVIAIENGWGIAPECQRHELLASVVFDGAEGHSFCGFVTYVLSAVEPGSAAAWKAAVGFAADHGLSLPPTWLMAGFRRNDLTDLLDVRYHFDPAVQGFPATPATTWSASPWSRSHIFGNTVSGSAWGAVGGLMGHAAFWREPAERELAASPALEPQAALVDDLADWLARMRYAVQLGFERRAGEAGDAPMPWTPSVAAFRPELSLRLHDLDELREEAVLPQAEYAKQRAIAENLSAPTAGRRWTAEELTLVKMITDQISGAMSYFTADLAYSGTVQTASQLWAVDQVTDAFRYAALEYGWQKFGPRRLGVDQRVMLAGAGIDQ